MLSPACPICSVMASLLALKAASSGLPSASGERLPRRLCSGFARSTACTTAISMPFAGISRTSYPTHHVYPGHVSRFEEARQSANQLRDDKEDGDEVLSKEEWWGLAEGLCSSRGSSPWVSAWGGWRSGGEVWRRRIGRKRVDGV